ncbi:hypothetical protein B0H17DRAFT_1142616 [Mycena rosella]|uniref:Uncharacterized protein n=1 Tax=Mycena rosella TaxID=1033263 RepID=A0AAD7CXC5_MYCRO|nr:hypothetical protein B0H17DRAFT_1142616 [Mycena rosella]
MKILAENRQLLNKNNDLLVATSKKRCNAIGTDDLGYKSQITTIAKKFLLTRALFVDTAMFQPRPLEFPALQDQFTNDKAYRQGVTTHLYQDIPEKFHPLLESQMYADFAKDFVPEHRDGHSSLINLICKNLPVILKGLAIHPDILTMTGADRSDNDVLIQLLCLLAYKKAMIYPPVLFPGTTQNMNDLFTGPIVMKVPGSLVPGKKPAANANGIKMKLNEVSESSLAQPEFSHVSSCRLTRNGHPQALSLQLTGKRNREFVQQPYEPSDGFCAVHAVWLMAYMAGDILPCFSSEIEYDQRIEISSENCGSPTANVATTVLCTIYDQNTSKPHVERIFKKVHTVVFAGIDAPQAIDIEGGSDGETEDAITDAMKRFELGTDPTSDPEDSAEGRIDAAVTAPAPEEPDVGPDAQVKCHVHFAGPVDDVDDVDKLAVPNQRCHTQNPQAASSAGRSCSEGSSAPCRMRKCKK